MSKNDVSTTGTDRIVCQECGGDVLIEVEFGGYPGSYACKLWIECQECEEAGVLEDPDYIKQEENNA